MISDSLTHNRRAEQCVCSLCPEDDVVVGTSLAASMRHAKVARLTSDGNIVSQYQPYLDTAALGRLLEVMV